MMDSNFLTGHKHDRDHAFMVFTKLSPCEGDEDVGEEYEQWSRVIDE